MDKRNKVYAVGLLLLLVAFYPSDLMTAEQRITGKVYALGDQQVMVQLDPGRTEIAPKSGDAVDFFYQIPGTDESINAGKGRVVRVENDMVTVHLVEDSPPIDAEAIIKATGTFLSSSSTQSKPSTSGSPVLDSSEDKSQSGSASAKSRVIPNVIGLNVDKAKYKLSRTFTLTTVVKGMPAPSQNQVNLVYEQSIKAGTPIKKYESITITVYVNEEKEQLRKRKHDWLSSPTYTPNTYPEE